MSKTIVNILCLVALFLGVNLKVQAQSSTLTGNMNAKRVQPIASLLNNGEVLVTGGRTGNGANPSAELYNPSPRTFSYTGSMNTGRVYHAAALLPSGEVLIVGGENALFPISFHLSFKRGAVQSLQRNVQLYGKPDHRDVQSYGDDVEHGEGAGCRRHQR